MSDLITLVVDYETYYDDKYSLKKRDMPTLKYIRHELFKVHGAAVKENKDPARWISGRDLPAYFDSLDWSRIHLISHNYLFDGTITFERYGKSPAFRTDTLGLVRALLPADMDFGLDALGKALGLGGKVSGGKALADVKGVRDLTPEQEEALAVYAIDDAEKTYILFEKFYQYLPEIERQLLNITARMGTEARLHFNQERSKEALTEAIEKRAARIANSGVPETHLRSDALFAAELRKRGVEPPMKLSEKKTETARVANGGANVDPVYNYAFAKSDPAFIQLLDEPEVAPLVDARLAVKSTGDIRRLEKLREITKLPPHTIPMPLNYCGAHTTRWSGAGGINPQNLKKGPGGKPGKLRESFEAPPGYVINVADSAQIELRMNMWFCGQNDILEMLRTGKDVYSYTASNVMQLPMEHIDKTKRQFGKVVELGCGYGMGHKKFQAICAIGPMGNPPIHLSREEACNAVNTYRSTHPFVKLMWDWLSYVAIPAMAQKGCHLEKGPIVFQHHSILLPNGLSLLYPNLRYWEDPEGKNSGWLYGTNGVKHRIYGGLLLENIIQALARVGVAEQLAIIDREVAPVVTMTHDEVVALSPEHRAEEDHKAMIEIMSTPPSWAPDLPVAAEGGFARTYSK